MQFLLPLESGCGGLPEMARVQGCLPGAPSTSTMVPETRGQSTELHSIMLKDMGLCLLLSVTVWPGANCSIVPDLFLQWDERRKLYVVCARPQRVLWVQAEGADFLIAVLYAAWLKTKQNKSSKLVIVSGAHLLPQLLGKLRQEDCKSEAFLGYTVRPKLAWET